MAEVTGLTKERMLDIEASSVVSARLEGEDLILTTRGGQDTNVGKVVGRDGVMGQDGAPGVVIVHHGTDPNVPRPDDSPLVYWIGTADPVNAHPYDFRLEENV